LDKIAFVIYYHKHNFYSLNAIVGALESQQIYEKIEFFFIGLKDELVDSLEKLEKKYNKIVLAISFFTTQLFDIRALVRTIKYRFNNRVFIIAGGSHPTGDPSGTLKMGFDVVVVGEGEETIIDLMKKLAKDENFYNVKGIAYLNKENQFIYTGKRNLINLDDYPPFPVKNIRFGAIEITRGCPYVCYFCQTPYISGTSPRHRSIQKICESVQILANYYGDLTDVRFITPNAFSYGSIDGINLNLEKLESLLINIRKIIGEKGRIFMGTFPSEVRPEHVTEKTLDLVIKYADNDNITIGAQSGSQKILDSCHRGHSVEEINNAVELTLKNNLKINVDFIFGLPGENDEDIMLTIRMMKDLSNRGARVHAHSFIPLPKTPFAKKDAIRIKDTYRKEINTLISKGFAFGDWKRQERFAIKYNKHLKKQQQK
jgi:B12-binding domain/radical SAM domain protein